MTQSALSSGNLDSLRGTASVASRFVQRLRVSMNPNTTIYSARVNQSSFTASFAQITYDGGSGTLANILPGMRVLLSHTNDKSAYYWWGIVRKTPGASTLYIGETSFLISDNDYIFILNDFPIIDKLAREVSGVQNNFYDISFRQLLPVIYNLKSVYAGDINSGTSKLTIAFAPLAYAATSGASISSWLWTIDGTTTITVGSTTTQNITAAFDEGHHYIHLRVTDSGGRQLTRHIEIHAHGSTYTYQLMAVSDVSINANVASGFDATLTNFVAPSGLLDLTQICMWSDDTYQTGDGTITGDNILFLGRIRTRENTTAANDQYGLDKSAAYTVEGPLTQLSRTEQLPYEMLNVASPTKFGQIKDMTLYRGIVYLLSEYSTFLELHSLTFDAFDNTYLCPTRNPDGDILTAVNDLAFSINAALEIEPSGAAQVVRHASMLESGRNSLVTRADLTTSDLLSFTLRQDGARPVGLMKAFGGSYNSTTNLFTTAEAHAPGLAPESGSQKLTLDRQVLPANLSYSAAKAAVKTRATNGLEKAQEVDKLDATFTPSWYSVLIPSLNVWYTFTLDSTMTVDGAQITKTVMTSSTRWLLTEVQLGLNAQGIPEVKGSFIKETAGITEGFGVDYPPPSTPTIPSYPASPSVPMFPVPPVYLPPTPTGDEIPIPVTINLPLDGNAAIVSGTEGSEQSLKFTTTLLQLPAPYTRQIIPADLGAGEVIKDLKCNPFGNKHGLYLLTYDTALLASRVWYTSDYTAYPILWSSGDAVEGEFTELRIVYGGDGKVIMLGSANAGTDLTLDVSTYNGGNGQDMGIAIVSGDEITITATGTVNYDISNTTTPAGTGSPLVGGVLSSAPVGRLLARVGTSGTWENIGASGSFTAAADGNLYLIMNDLDTAPDYSDNSGSYALEVHIYWDLRVSEHGVTVGDFTGFPASNVPDLGVVGSWVSTAGFRTQWVENYFGSFDADFIRLVLPNVLRIAAISQIIVYSSQTTVIPITASSGAPGMTPFFPTPDVADVNTDGARGTWYQLYHWNTATDARNRSLEMSYLTGDGNHTDITGLDFSFTSTPSNIVTCYSSDFGATFAAPEGVDTDGSWIDTQKDGTQVLVGAVGKTKKATAGSSYSAYGDPKTQGCGVAPRYKLTATTSNSGANPEYVLFADALDGGESMFIASSSGTVYDPITPNDGADDGLATGTRCLNVHSLSSGLNSHILAIGLFDTTVKLAVSLDAGGSFEYSSALDDDAFGIVTLRGDTSKKLAAWVNGNKIAVMKNYQAASPTFVEKEFGMDSITAFDLVG